MCTSNEIHRLARQAAQARDEGKHSRILELYNQAKAVAQGDLEAVCAAFARAGVPVTVGQSKETEWDSYMLSAVSG